ncbi:MAG TPA: response regulator [Polyangiaceae bacterium]|nr:response regulator [Polyangiaceae bacterium]
MSHVLVAEDDPEMRRLVVEALRKEGHHVMEVVDGRRLRLVVIEAFWRGATVSPIDVVVSDIRMPGCSGLDLLERLVAAGWRIPFVLMTAFGDEDTRRRAETLGAVVFDKPLALESLCAAVRRMTSGPPPSSPCHFDPSG